MGNDNDLTVDDALNIVKSIFSQKEIYDALMRLFPNHFAQQKKDLNVDLTDTKRRLSICDGVCPTIPISERTKQLTAQLAESTKQDKIRGMFLSLILLKFNLKTDSPSALC